MTGQDEQELRDRSAGPDGAAPGFSGRDIEDIEESARLRAPMIYEILRREGKEEMERPATSLWWSGVAAGLSISFSLVAQSALQWYLPDEAWRPLVSGFGYSVGFLIVVLARQQLFTENTITVVLPVAAKLSRTKLAKLGRLWALSSLPISLVPYLRRYSVVSLPR